MINKLKYAYSDGWTQEKCLVLNRLGLHARAAAKFVKIGGSFEAEVWVSRNGIRVSGTSILGLMMLAATSGTEILIEAKGPEAEKAVEALITLVSTKFDED
jgi:phosphocarrier protein